MYCNYVITYNNIKYKNQKREANYQMHHQGETLCCISMNKGKVDRTRCSLGCEIDNDIYPHKLHDESCNKHHQCIYQY